MAEPRADRLVWMDLEMSGLDPTHDRILELAVLVTDGDLELVAEGPEIIVHQSDELLDGMDEWNTTHHTESGLVARVRASTTTEREAEEAILAFLREQTKERTAPLAGNSIHQDRRFIQTYMTELDEHLHYRNVDVSTVKELVRRWYPDIAEQTPPKSGAHRALDDIKESIQELRFYQSAVFRPR
ncbi:MAG: oligoribonuclease [Planctomycetota bacterium]